MSFYICIFLLLFSSLLYHCQILSYKRKSVTLYDICTKSCYKVFLFKLKRTSFRKPQFCNTLTKKGSTFRNIGQNNAICLPLFGQPWLFLICIKRIYCWSHPLPGSEASFWLPLVLESDINNIHIFKINNNDGHPDTTILKTKPVF